MRGLNRKMIQGWARVGPGMLPFADVATAELPIRRLLRLAMFQLSVGMAVTLLTGTLNRVMIIELGVSAWLVALMVSLPIVFAPLRALIGFRSDVYRSALGWRRVPFIWMGTMLQFGGFAIMPFALLVLSGDGHGPVVYGQIGAALAFLLVGAGLHTTQTAGLALATDLARPEHQPRVVALLFVMLLVGMFLSSLLFGWLLRDFTQIKLIRVIQGAAVVTVFFNLAALWKQEARNPERTNGQGPVPSFAEAWAELRADRRAGRLLVAVALGSAGFAMQDILLEPFGGEILNLSVGRTTGLTAILSGGMLAAFWLSARLLAKGNDPHRLAAYGALIGVFAFAAISFVSATKSGTLFASSVAMIGFGGGLFAVGTLTAAMNLASNENSGLALGAWGAVQATASGIGIAAGGAIRDVVSGLASRGSLGPALVDPVTGYAVVYQVEIVLLFATLVAIGPLAAFSGQAVRPQRGAFGLARFPG